MACIPFSSCLPLQLAFFHRSHLLMHLWTLWDHRGNNCPAFLHLHLYWRSSVAAVLFPVEQAVLWYCSYMLLLHFWWNKPSLKDAVQLHSPMLCHCGGGASGQVLCNGRLLLSSCGLVLQSSGVSCFWNPCQGVMTGIPKLFCIFCFWPKVGNLFCLSVGLSNLVLATQLEPGN